MNRKKAVGSQLPGGSELDALAWGHHIEQAAKWKGVAEEIREFTNTASLGLLSGTGRAEWATYHPRLGVGVPISRAQVLDMTPAEALEHYFDTAEASRTRGPQRAFNPANRGHVDTALVNMTGGVGTRHGELPLVVNAEGVTLLKAQGLRAQLGRAQPVPAPRAPRAPRAAALIEDVLPTMEDLAEADDGITLLLEDLMANITPLPPL